MEQPSVNEWSKFEHMEAEEVLRWAIIQYSPQVALSCSFGAEDVVLVDMAVRIHPQIRVFTLDTGRLAQETYDAMERVREKYGIRIESFFPQAEAVEAIVREYGPNPFYRSTDLRKLCCRIRKVEPLQRALEGMRAWVTGLRRGQSITRTHLAKAEIEDGECGRLKISPLADWTSRQVWDYIRARGLPYNELHDRGYPSIGCAPCTRAIGPGEDERAGRWWWESREQKECGLHLRGTGPVASIVR